MTTLSKALRLFHVTYDVVTPESSVDGDTSDNGFLNADGIAHPVADIWGEDVRPIQAACAMTLREALALCSPQENAGRWFTEVDGAQDYSTGAETRNSLHPPASISEASYSRLCKLLKL